jgi:hypothetical protein
MLSGTALFFVSTCVSIRGVMASPVLLQGKEELLTMWFRRRKKGRDESPSTGVVVGTKGPNRAIDAVSGAAGWDVGGMLVPTHGLDPSSIMAHESAAAVGMLAALGVVAAARALSRRDNKALAKMSRQDLSSLSPATLATLSPGLRAAIAAAKQDQDKGKK